MLSLAHRGHQKQEQAQQILCRRLQWRLDRRQFAGGQGTRAHIGRQPETRPEGRWYLPLLSPSSYLLDIVVSISSATEDAVNALYRVLSSCSLLNEKSSLSGSNFDFHIVVHSETLSEMLWNGDLTSFGNSHDFTSMNSRVLKSYLIDTLVCNLLESRHRAMKR